MCLFVCLSVCLFICLFVCVIVCFSLVDSVCYLVDLVCLFVFRLFGCLFLFVRLCG